MMVSVVFADIENVPEYGFDFKALTVTLILFVLTYELVMYLYSRSIKRLYRQERYAGVGKYTGALNYKKWNNAMNKSAKIRNLRAFW